VAGRIQARLAPKGYDRLLYYSVPGGFAVATELERFGSDGRPTGGDKRFQRGKVGGWGSILDFCRRLIEGEDGRFRIFVFVVTFKPFIPESYPATDEDVQHWVSTGAPILPPAIASQATPRGTAATLMVYEFVENKGVEQRLDASRSVPPSAHLRWLGFPK
jgi:hypothetical protein